MWTRVNDSRKPLHRKRAELECRQKCLLQESTTVSDQWRRPKSDEKKLAKYCISSPDGEVFKWQLGQKEGATPRTHTNSIHLLPFTQAIYFHCCNSHWDLPNHGMETYLNQKRVVCDTVNSQWKCFSLLLMSSANWQIPIVTQSMLFMCRSCTMIPTIGGSSMMENYLPALVTTAIVWNGFDFNFFEVLYHMVLFHDLLNPYCFDLNLICWCSAASRIKNKEGPVVLFWCDCKVDVSNAVSLTI